MEQAPKSSNSWKTREGCCPLKGTFFYLNLNKQKHGKARHIERMLVQRGAKICAFLHERVTHMLIDEEEQISRNISVGHRMTVNRLPTHTRSMRMIDESCRQARQNQAVNLLTCSVHVAADRLDIKRVTLSEILRSDKIQNQYGHT